MVIEFITILYRAIFETSAWAFFLAGLIIRQGATDYSPAMMIGLALYGVGIFVANRSVDRQLREIE